MGRVAVRPARPDDERALRRIDDETWTTLTSPAPKPAAGGAFFDERTFPADVLVAELDGAVAGYVKVRPVMPLAEAAHVLVVDGLAVDPKVQGRGVGRALMEAAAAEARARGARRLTLRVLSHNEAARRLYERCGYEVEGVLHELFLLDGEYVDDVLMALDLTAVSPS